MFTFLLKSTVIWSVLLLFYFALLSKEKSPGYNRLYLWISLFAGILIPFIPNLGAIPMDAVLTESVSPGYIQSVKQLSGVIGAKNATNGYLIDWSTLLFYLWLIGGIIQMLLLVKNAIQLYFFKKLGQKRHHPISDYFIHAKTDTPYSFGKFIFLPATTYTEKDLAFILEHERHHFVFHHWIDNLMLALLQTLFWFHPLFYIFKHQIKLVQEYQVDSCIAAADSYDYGKLLLAQHTQFFKKALVHTFNYSPLKKRIAMMTNTKKSSTWKYALSIPLFTFSLLLMSANKKTDQRRITKGNITNFEGNTVEWGTSMDTISMMGASSGKVTRMITARKYIKNCNGQPVTQGFDPKNQAANPDLDIIRKNVIKGLLLQKANIPKDILMIQVMNLVLDRNFKVHYYDVATLKKDKTDDGEKFETNAYPSINNLVDKILRDKNQLNPQGLKSDKPFYVLEANVDFEPTMSPNVKTPAPKGTFKLK